ncbi:endo-1,3-alpha-glucanase family glycosylhydrolase [Embleya sp. NPDC020630]|uniref:endo-1,3-alpha-glucanase family glycosylhydrolase n=1 Tax=Embleya sp. NPDC020630 TaxID=3363979 RepID=UPI00378AEB63
MRPPPPPERCPSRCRPRRRCARATRRCTRTTSPPTPPPSTTRSRIRTTTSAITAPSANSGHTWVDISDYYLVRLKTGAWPAITRDTAYLTHRVQFAAARPTGGQTKLMTPRAGTDPPRDSVEVLTFLVAPATVNATIGGAGQSYQAAAGVQARLFPLAYGTNSASVVRGAATVATVSSAHVVRKDFAAQDLGYRGTSSGRPGAG